MTNILSPTVPLRRRLFSGRFVAVILVLAALAGGVWILRTSLLRGAANLWIVSDPVVQSDVVAVLGGDLEVRPFIAAELYGKGLVRKVLVSQVPGTRSSKIGGVPGHSGLQRTLLLNLGVPDTAVEMFGEANRNTKDEAVALRDWADRHGVSRIIIPTEIFAARRVRWVFDREFAGSSVRLAVLSFEPPQYTRAEWWKSEGGMIAFQNEVMKYIYYRMKY
jgi:uncharacterized SAM-binding protein YcdF (DUF218 family)